MTRLGTPSKRALIAVAIAAFAVFVLTFTQYLSASSSGSAGVGVVILWAVALLVLIVCVTLIRKANRPSHLSVFTFALIYAALVVILHWIWDGVLT